MYKSNRYKKIVSLFVVEPHVIYTKVIGSISMRDSTNLKITVCRAFVNCVPFRISSCYGGWSIIMSKYIYIFFWGGGGGGGAQKNRLVVTVLLSTHC